jgi:hypothetical protein
LWGGVVIFTINLVFSPPPPPPTSLIFVSHITINMVLKYAVRNP